MAKRFTDTEKWKKKFLRALQAPYKLLWFYLLDDCNIAGIWEVDFEIARIKVGEEITEEKAKEVFGERIQIFDGGKKWFVPDFLEFQYGELNPKNRMHAAVLSLLSRYNLHTKGLTSPLEGAKDKDKDMDKDKDKVKDKDLMAELNSKVDKAYEFYPSRRQNNTSTNKSHKDKIGIKRLYETGYDVMAGMELHIKTCNGYLMGLSRFINHPPDLALPTVLPEKKAGPKKHVHDFRGLDGQRSEVCLLCGEGLEASA